MCRKFNEFVLIEELIKFGRQILLYDLFRLCNDF